MPELLAFARAHCSPFRFLLHSQCFELAGCNGASPLAGGNLITQCENEVRELALTWSALLNVSALFCAATRLANLYPHRAWSYRSIAHPVLCLLCRLKDQQNKHLADCTSVGWRRSCSVLGGCGDHQRPRRRSVCAVRPRRGLSFQQLNTQTKSCKTSSTCISCRTDPAANVRRAQNKRHQLQLEAQLAQKRSTKFA